MARSLIQHYESATELEDGSILKACWRSRIWPSTHDSPEESEDSEMDFFLDGEPINESDLEERHPECTQQFLWDLQSSGHEVVAPTLWEDAEPPYEDSNV